MTPRRLQLIAFAVAHFSSLSPSAFSVPACPPRLRPFCAAVPGAGTGRPSRACLEFFSVSFLFFSLFSTISHPDPAAAIDPSLLLELAFNVRVLHSVDVDRASVVGLVDDHFLRVRVSLLYPC